MLYNVLNLLARSLWIIILFSVISGCQNEPLRPAVLDSLAGMPLPNNADDFLIVDCLLPGQVRSIGLKGVFLTPRRPIRTSAWECKVRGGEYTSYDRATRQTALRVWLEAAQEGDAEAQTIVGEIFQKGWSTSVPDYQQAENWYRKAAAQGHARAQINLGYLYEQGLGVSQNQAQAQQWYGQAMGISEVPTPPRAVAPDNTFAIELDQPQVYVKNASAKVDGSHAEQVISGRVTGDNEVRLLWINQQAISLNNGWYFSTSIALQGKEIIPIHIVAENIQKQKAELKFQLEPVSINQPSVQMDWNNIEEKSWGNNYALIIGNQQYQEVEGLETPIKDALDIAGLLEHYYAYKATTLLNATRFQILQRLNELTRTLQENDNLLLYYAGHGYIRSRSPSGKAEGNTRGTDMKPVGGGYWIPVDASFDNNANWISNQEITDLVNVYSSRRVLVITDSCYSGTMTGGARGLSEETIGNTEDMQRILNNRSRTVMASGGVKPVMDKGGDGHSVFANALINTLKNNTKITSANAIYLQVRKLVASNSGEFNQQPEYAPIQNSHSGGDFFFVPKKTHVVLP